MVNLPSGTVTFVFTDIEGSTGLLKRLGDADYAALLAVHRRLVRDIFGGHQGQEIDTQGDAFFYSFVRARQAVAAAIEVQRAHVKATWPGDAEVRVRLGLHTGEPAIGDEGYTGLDVVRAARIAAVGSGGQVLISDTTRAIAAGDLPEGVTLRSLGDRTLKDIDRPEPIWELVIDGVDAATAPSPPPEQPAADEINADPSPWRDAVQRARQQIEDRVLASLAESFPDAVNPVPPTPPPSPPGRRDRSMTREIARLHALREEGALTGEQYRRAVDRLLGAEREDAES